MSNLIYITLPFILYYFAIYIILLCHLYIYYFAIYIILLWNVEQTKKIAHIKLRDTAR